MERVLVIGGTGFVGNNLSRCFSEDYDVVIASRNPREGIPYTWYPLDITQPGAADELLAKLAPTAVIHAAGVKDVRFCENNPEYAFRVNGQGTLNVASACSIAGCKLLYLSTDLVFPCDSGWYREVDRPGSPLIYGRSKAIGEEHALRIHKNVAVCRSGGVYGRVSPLLRWVADQLRDGHDVECFTDVYNTPTYADNLADMLKDIIASGRKGIFHTVGAARVNRFEFFSLFASEFNLDRSRLKPVAAGNDRRREMLLMPDSSLSSEVTTNVLKVKGISPEQGFKLLRESCGI